MWTSFRRSTVFLWVFLAVAGLAIGANMHRLAGEAGRVWDRPLERRAQQGMLNMQSAIGLIRAVLPATTDGMLLGFYCYGNDDPVNQDQLSMCLGYHLFPLRVRAVQRSDFARCDYIVMYQSSVTEQLRALMPANWESRTSADGAFVCYGPRFAQTWESPRAARGPRWAGWTHFGLIAGLVPFLGIPGWLMLRRFGMQGQPTLWLPVGVAVLSIVQVCGALCGLMAWPWLLLGVAAVMAIICSPALQSPGTDMPGPKSKAGGERHLLLPGIVIGLFWLGLMAAIALSTPVADITGLGIWAYKAKAFHAAGGVDWTRLTDPMLDHIQPNYPIGFPVLLAWFYAVLGTVDDWVIRMVPLLLGGGAAMSLVWGATQMGVPTVIAVAGAVLYCTGDAFSTQCISVQAETLLLLLAIPAFALCAMHVRNPSARFTGIAALLLGAAANVKAEGLVYGLVALGVPSVRALLLCSALLVVLFGSVYVFSVFAPNRLEWHLLSAERLLLLPTALCLISLLQLLCPGSMDAAKRSVHDSTM